MQVLITGFHFGEMDGTDFCRAVRTFDRDTPIIFFTGESREDQRRAAGEAGAQAYITKPAELEKVVQTVIRLIKETRWLNSKK